MEEPLAKYEEARFELRRQFELFPDRIRVTGKGLYIGRFDQTIPLHILHAPPGRLWVRGVLWRYGLRAWFFAACLTTGVGVGGGSEAFTNPWVVGTIGALVWAGLMLTAANFRPAEFARFQTDAGIIALDVGRVGPQAEEFDEFIDLLVSQIETARAKAGLTR